MSSPRLKVLYACGPGNTLAATKSWLAGNEYAMEIASCYSSMFLEACKNHDIEAYLVSRYQATTLKKLNHVVTVEHRPKKTVHKNALAYHLEQIKYGLSIIKTALTGKFDLVIAADGTTHWFVFLLLKPFKTKLVGSLHTTVYSKRKQQLSSMRWIVSRLINGFVFRYAFDGLLVVSQTIRMEIEELTNGHAPPIIEFLPNYQRDMISETKRSISSKSTFKLLYIGRIAKAKGPFLLVEIAKKLASENLKFTLDICGDGPDLEELRNRVNENTLNDFVTTYGHLDSENLNNIISISDLLLIPTSADFSEGFCKIVCEAMISGLPVISSDAVPGNRYARDAVIEVEADNAEQYCSAIKDLLTQPERYQTMSAATEKYREQFYNFKNSYQTGIDMILSGLINKKIIQDKRIKLVDEN